MLRTTGPAAKPDIQKVVDGILREDHTFDRNENRSAHRENLVRGITIEVRGGEGIIEGFSRNISATGIGVITNRPILANSTAVVSIAGLAQHDTQILAECRWCKPYGKNWFLSGWQFISLKR